MLINVKESWKVGKSFWLEHYINITVFTITINVFLHAKELQSITETTHNTYGTFK